MEKLNFIRVAGTAGEVEAAGIISGELKKMGLEPSLESFEIDDFEISKAELTVFGGGVGIGAGESALSFPVTGYGMSGSTAGSGLRAPFFYAENGNDIAMSQARGKIVLLNKMVTAPQYHKLVEAGAAGFIAISGTLTDKRDETDLERRFLNSKHLKNGELAKIPGVSIRAIDAIELLRAAPTEAAITLAQTEKKGKSNNVIAVVEGSDKADEWITVGAHYDSVPFSRGMYDNASGSAIILEACRYFTENKPRRSLRFIWFGAEERGLVGSRYHITANPDEIAATLAMINLDLAGQIIGHHEFAVSAQKQVGDILRFIAQESGFPVTVRQNIYSSDSTAYADAGVPSFSFLRSGTIGHSRYDEIKFTSAATMEKTTDFTLHCMGRIINSEILPIPRGIPDDLKEKLEVYFGRKPPKEEE
jgi:hypothetical protein